jgi:glycosyltransferase involved in cell wall biosynthesis
LKLLRPRGDLEMRIIQSAGFYYPDSTGGTEAYVASLAKSLRAEGVECMVAAPLPSDEPIRNIHQGVDVFRYPVPERWLRREVQGRDPPRRLHFFEDWLRQQRADVYHQHSWTTGCGLWHLKTAKRLGLKTILTVHVPGNLCMRGTMLYGGHVACDGKIVPEKCASCWLQSKGLPASAARGIAKLPQPVGSLGWLPRVGSALTARALAAGRIEDLQAMSAAADRVVAVCQWLQDALRANGVPARKLVLNRQGVAEPGLSTSSRPRRPSDVVRFGFLGRWDPVKGVHVLVEAFKRLPPDLPVTLDICAAAQGRVGEKYRDCVQRSGLGDPRIQVLPAIPHREVGAFLSGLEAVAVPSQWLETGPLVVLEAFASGAPVIGSHLGGIRELVGHGRDGLLVPHDDVSAWTTAMLRLATDRALLERLRKGIGPVRSMSDVGREMAALYREIIGMDRYAA